MIVKYPNTYDNNRKYENKIQELLEKVVKKKNDILEEQLQRIENNIKKLTQTKEELNKTTSRYRIASISRISKRQSIT